MSAKAFSANSRLLRLKAQKVRSSLRSCEERWACSGRKPHAVFVCKQCSSYQCELCEALLHDDFRLALHEREAVIGPSLDELCEGNCENKNFADVTCESCSRNFCLVCDHLVHTRVKRNHLRIKFVNQTEEFLSCDEISDEYLKLIDSTYEDTAEELSHSEMMSLQSMLNESMPDLCPEHESESNYNSSKKSDKNRSFLLLNEKEVLQVKDPETFLQYLGCGDKKLKVISIFGNTGDGKSYTLNHTFYNGEEIFQTSAAQESCTIGVWAAYCPSMGIITIDTEGFLGQASNPNKRARMLLKVLAISDLIIYRTRAERLHNDMFSFLGDASAAYTKHFCQELEEASTRCNMEGPLSVLGPAVIIFHETQHTDVLSKNDGSEPEVTLRTRFQDLGLKVDAFCSMEYLGLCSNSKKTNFSLLKTKIGNQIQNSTVRIARSPVVIFEVLKLLNEKFNGIIDKAIPNTFPDQYFTCSSYCKSCKSRCSNSMNHAKDDIPHASSNNCTYQHQYDNRIFICKTCIDGGHKSIVSPKVMESNDTSWVGYARYVLSGYILECAKCGVIYRSRQFWFGNQNPWDTCVQKEICHVWPDEMVSEMPQNTAQYVIDNISSVSEIVSKIGAKPTKVISSWVADQIAPTYWIPNSRITVCGICKKDFEDLETKHHCRICGGGFCDECTSFSRIVPNWGSSEVRVCKACANNENSVLVNNCQNPNDVTARKIGEAVQSTLGTVASAINYPIGFIKDSARPSYWISDKLLLKCCVCNEPFGPKLSIHHCRYCGDGVCSSCSKQKKPVPFRGWDYPVRVCDACFPKDDLPSS